MSRECVAWQGIGDPCLRSGALDAIKNLSGRFGFGRNTATFVNRYFVQNRARPIKFQTEQTLENALFTKGLSAPAYQSCNIVLWGVAGFEMRVEHLRQSCMGKRFFKKTVMHNDVFVLGTVNSWIA